MQLRPLLGFLIVAGLASSVRAVNVPDFTLPHLFSFEIQIAADADAVVYPYGGGQRVNIAITSGTLTKPGNGTIATVVPGLGGEQGVLREDGVLLADARIVLQSEQSFDPDRKFSFLQVRGKTVFAADGKGLLFMWVFSSSSVRVDTVVLTSALSEFETDSAPLAYLNGYFLACKMRRNGQTLNFEAYGVRLKGQLVICAKLTSNQAAPSTI